MMQFRKTAALGAAFLMAFSLASCGFGTSSSPKSAEEAESISEESTAETGAESAEEVSGETPEERSDMTAEGSSAENAGSTEEAPEESAAGDSEFSAADSEDKSGSGSTAKDSEGEKDEEVPIITAESISVMDSEEAGAEPAEESGAESSGDSSGESAAVSGEEEGSGQESAPSSEEITSEVITLDPSWDYADYSKINSGSATIYYAPASVSNGKTVCINAGHGTQGGSSVKTLCHPDGSPKVTGGTTGAGATEAIAVSTGMQFADGTAEAAVNLKLALIVKERLLAEGYNVLMIRESDDVQLDNIARTVIANNRADCHIALHYDSTDFDKGAFFMSVPSNESYRAMEPVASHYEEHLALGRSVVRGLSSAGVKIFENGELEQDLTQTSYSTVPSIDLECGDKVSDYSDEMHAVLAEGITAGLNLFFGFA